MELSAILWTFLKYGSKNDKLTIYSDSAYCVNTLTNWMFSWEKNNWKKSNNKTPENLDLIKPFFNYFKLGNIVELKKVKGHAENKWNNMAD